MTKRRNIRKRVAAELTVGEELVRRLEHFNQLVKRGVTLDQLSQHGLAVTRFLLDGTRVRTKGVKHGAD